MNEDIENPTPITRRLATEKQRLIFTRNLFGTNFPLIIEPTVYGITERMAADDHGGYWHMYILDGGGFYMAPQGDQLYHVSCDNFWTGELSADALGITACLYTYSHLSFSTDTPFAGLCARQYHLLRTYMYEHPEMASILRAID